MKVHLIEGDLFVCYFSQGENQTRSGILKTFFLDTLSFSTGFIEEINQTGNNRPQALSELLFWVISNLLPIKLISAQITPHLGAVQRTPQNIANSRRLNTATLYGTTEFWLGG